ncbi:MAG: hypothetical protein K6G63_04800 [Eubacterium sp.]|nr:hypothetical protein [Eubacterium sp.]
MSNLIKNGYINVQQGKAVVIDHSGDNGGFDSFTEGKKFKTIAELEVEKGLQMYGDLSMASIMGESEEVSEVLPESKPEIQFDEEIEAQDISLEEKATAQAEKIVNEARQLAEQIQQEAEAAGEQLKAEAYEEGLHRGYEEGMKKASEDLDAREQEILELDRKSKAELSQCIDTIEQKYVGIVMSLVEKLTGKVVENSPDVILYLIKSAARDMEKSREIKIRVCTDELPGVEALKSEIQAEIGGDCTVEIVPDSAVDVGQCIIETEHQMVDCGIKTQLEMLQRDLSTLIGE